MILLGTSGWSYDDWVGSFYPSKKHQFTYFSKIFHTAEINSTFYRFPSQKVTKSWARVPDNFIFTAKIPQEITHKLRLDLSKGADQRLWDFIRLMTPVHEARRLGPLLLQLPPSFEYDDMEVLESFLKVYPADWELVVEFRHLTWMRDETFELLRKYKAAYCIVDEPLLPPRVEVTAPFSYIRWHGHGKKLWYYYLYSQEELKQWAPKVKAIEKQCTKPVYGYMNNHWHGFAARNCIEMMELLGIPHQMPSHVRDRLRRVTDQRSKKKPTQQASLSDFSEE